MKSKIVQFLFIGLGFVSMRAQAPPFPYEAFDQALQTMNFPEFKRKLVEAYEIYWNTKGEYILKQGEVKDLQEKCKDVEAQVKQLKEEDSLKQPEPKVSPEQLEWNRLYLPSRPTPNKDQLSIAMDQQICLKKQLESAIVRRRFLSDRLGIANKNLWRLAKGHLTSLLVETKGDPIVYRRVVDLVGIYNSYLKLTPEFQTARYWRISYRPKVTIEEESEKVSEDYLRIFSEAGGEK